MKRKTITEYERGVRMAAEVADAYNSSSTHAYRLGDCILAKLNLLTGELPHA